MKNVSVVFAGTPDFARASLAALMDAGVKPVAVLTQPDRPAGRGKKVLASPVKLLAQDADIPVWQPETLRGADTVSRLGALEPDLVIVAAYGLLLPQSFLDVPRLGCVNVHASLLPRWRGAAPIQAAILSGDDETGISLMRMEAGLDTGPVYARAATPIDSDETAGELHDRLAALGGKLLVENLSAIFDDTLEAKEQDEAGASYAPKIKTSDAKMNWGLKNTQLRRHIKAYNPVPGARFEFRGEVIKCWNADTSDGQVAPPGRVMGADRDGIIVACGDGNLCLTELQRPGRRRVTAGEFASQFDLGDASFQ
jgi:methionyl-tRNA formyltransferase